MVVDIECFDDKYWFKLSGNNFYMTGDIREIEKLHETIHFLLRTKNEMPEIFKKLDNLTDLFDAQYAKYATCGYDKEIQALKDEIKLIKSKQIEPQLDMEALRGDMRSLFVDVKKIREGLHIASR